MKKNAKQLQQFIDHAWASSIVPALIEYIKIPNKSPHFDPDWEKHGYMDQAVNLMVSWCKEHKDPDMTVQVKRIKGRTPVIIMEIPGSVPGNILLYGHLDKQPEMTGWNKGLGPWTPVLKNGKLYGRGGADDGYAIFSALTAIKGLRSQNIAHPRCVILIEASEESGSDDLPYYVSALKKQIGVPELVICLDSGCGNYDQLWTTTSLRGLIGASLRVDVLEEGVHSGLAGGIVPSSFRILRDLLARLENKKTGEILLKEAHVKIPANRIDQARKAAKVLNKDIYEIYHFSGKMRPQSENHVELLLNNTWRPMLEVTGMDGLPSIKNAGNVLRPFTEAKLSLRLPPTGDPERVAKKLKSMLEKNPPYGAKVSLTILDAGRGWNAPKESAHLVRLVRETSLGVYGREPLAMGLGGTIPFMGMLGEKFPKAQFLVTGVLGPKSNAHGPNEFLHIEMAKKLTRCVAQVLAGWRSHE